uniref:Retrovirus-related Pol polyprotein from transposon TNT 1-94 n=1 Tax=Tanacetum cinerariifolium TaxID=118510 RepID=A0A699H3V0_TANCI|nr:retrovirus-related Pol polyprotein from transposon TNT 1-94 [Tanacetum cinerariifolium]GEX28021.1 retrovirus-related Pol polyprotein from transposon TNT 1-94 [Tanacetum cinerariifolium]
MSLGLTFQMKASTSSHPAPQDRWSRDQHIGLVNIIGNPGKGMLTKSMAAKLTAASASECLFADFLSKTEPKNMSEALKHPGSIDAMQKKLNQFYRNKVWNLVPLPYRKIAIGSNWVFRNKKDEHGTTTKNKARLVAQGYSQEEGINYDETFTPVARMEAIRIFLAFATYMNFKVYQMDVKSVFLNGKLKEEVCVKQPPSFESSEFPDYVCKLDKALYGLKQAPRSWNETLSTFLIQNKLDRGRIGFDIKGYSYSDYVGCNMDRKSTSGACQILGESWSVIVPRNSSHWLCPQLKLNMLLLLGVVQWSIRTSSGSFGALLLPLTLFHQLMSQRNATSRNFSSSFQSQTWQRPLTLDFKFFSSTDLDYNNGKYVDHPTPEVLGENYSSTEQVNSIQQLLAYSLITQNEVDIEEIIYSHLITKLLNKSRIKYILYPRFISYALQVLLGSEYTQDKKIRFLPPVLSNFNFIKDLSKVTDIELTSHMIIENNQRDSLSPPPLVAKPKKGKSQTVAPILPKSQGPEASGALSKKRTKPKSKRPPTETKESPPKLTKGSEQSHSEDQTQSSRLRYQSLIRNKGKPLYEEELDTQPMLLTYADVRAIFLSEDEAQESDEEVLTVGDDIDEDPQDDKEVRTSSPKQVHPAASHVQKSASVLSSLNLKRFDNILPLAERDQTDKLVEASMSSLDKSSTTISDIYKGLNVITQLLKEISKTLKDDPSTNQKINEATETFTRISSHIIEVLSLVKGFDFSKLLSTMKSIQDHVVKQEEATTSWMKTSTNMAWNLGSKMSGVELSQTAFKQEISSLRQDTSKIKSMMTEMYAAFQEQIKKAKEEAKLNAISKTKVIKVVRKEAKKLGIHPKEAISTKAGKLFKKAQDVEHEVLKIQHTKKIRKSLKLIKHKYNSYMWTISSRLKPEPITDIKIHLKTKPVVITVYRGTDGKKFNVHKSFLFGAFGISNLDELREIIPKKKYSEQASSQTVRRKWIHIELEPETRIPGLECNRTLPENFPFVNNMVIEEPEYGIFFTNEFSDQAFQRWSDIDKVGMKALVSYLVVVFSSLMNLVNEV